jgi:hypothetical protein
LNATLSSAQGRALDQADGHQTFVSVPVRYEGVDTFV